MRKILAVFCLMFALLGCGTKEMASPDPDKAARDVAPVLKTLYFDRDPHLAMLSFDPYFRSLYGTEDLARTVNDMEAGYGRLQRLDLESYEFTSGRRLIILYGSGYNEKNVSYHRLLVKLSKEGHFRIYSLSIAPKKHESKGKRALQKNIVIDGRNMYN